MENFGIELQSPRGRLLYSREHLAKLGFLQSNSTLLRWEAARKFPKRVHIGAQSVAWFAVEIHDHIAALAEQREAVQ